MNQNQIITQINRLILFMIKYIKVLNVNIMSLTRLELLENMKKGVLLTPNIDHLVNLQKNFEFYKAYQHAEWIVCDSKILFLCSKLFGKSFKEVIPGSSFFPSYCDYHKTNEDIKIFLLGAESGIAQIAMDRINNRIGRAIVVGAHSPSFGFEKDKDECSEIINHINGSSATVLVLGVGAPKQECWINKYREQCKDIQLFMALGATIDFEAGQIKRAPQIFQVLGIEWLYRIIKEPQRLWRRYLVDDMAFFYHFFKEKFGIYNNPFESSSAIAKKNKL